jgi:hypothetical protein
MRVVVSSSPHIHKDGRMRKAMRVRLEVREASEVALTASERIQLDRLEAGEDGPALAQHGELLGPGRNVLRLDEGVYHFQAVRDAALEIVRGGVTVTDVSPCKDLWPEPPEAAPADVDLDFTGKGDRLDGETPSLQVTCPAEPAC